MLQAMDSTIDQIAPTQANPMSTFINPPNCIQHRVVARAFELYQPGMVDAARDAANVAHALQAAAVELIRDAEGPDSQTLVPQFTVQEGENNQHEMAYRIVLEKAKSGRSMRSKVNRAWKEDGEIPPIILHRGRHMGPAGRR